MTAETADTTAIAIESERSRDDQAWARWLARAVDAVLLAPITLLAFAALGLAIEVGRAPVAILEWMENPVGLRVLELAASFLLMALWEPLFLSNTGTTPGKWIMGVSVRTTEGKKLSLPLALGRFVTVWFVGLGAGVPLLSLITMLMARAKLVNDGATGWDERLDTVVLHKKRHPLLWTAVIVMTTGVNLALTLWARSYSGEF